MVYAFADFKPRGANEGCRGISHYPFEDPLQWRTSIRSCGGYIPKGLQRETKLLRDGYSKIIMDRHGWGVVSDGFALVVYAVGAEEHRSERMVSMERGAWCLGMKRQKNYFNTNFNQLWSINRDKLITRSYIITGNFDTNLLV